MLTILLVLTAVSLFLWVLAMLGALPGDRPYAGWLAWFTCLFLALAVFVGSRTVIVT